MILEGPRGLISSSPTPKMTTPCSILPMAINELAYPRDRAAKGGGGGLYAEHVGHSPAQWTTPPRTRFNGSSVVEGPRLNGSVVEGLASTDPSPQRIGNGIRWRL
jgi:hypothetical protein